MLVVDGYFENGVFTPNKPVVNVNGRQEATLTIKESDIQEQQERIKRWGEIKKMLADSDDELLEGEPERVRFMTPEEIDAL
jgi:predicted DNA-binding antitoxin AbrB/MazE fold protein